MSENDANAGGEAGDNAGTSTPQTPSGPSAEYKGLQRKMAEKDQTITELAERVRALEGEPSVEEQLTRERAARVTAERALAKERTKAAAPELADVIDEFDLTDPALIERLRSKVAPAASAPADSSGLRNNPARPVSFEEDKMLDILKKGNLF